MGIFVVVVVIVVITLRCQSNGFLHKHKQHHSWHSGRVLLEQQNPFQLLIKNIQIVFSRHFIYQGLIGIAFWLTLLPKTNKIGNASGD